MNKEQMFESINNHIANKKALLDEWDSRLKSINRDIKALHKELKALQQEEEQIKRIKHDVFVEQATLVALRDNLIAND